MAATGGNKQPWEFVVVTEKVTIGALKVAAEWMEKSAAIIAVVLDSGGQTSPYPHPDWRSGQLADEGKETEGGRALLGRVRSALIG